MPCEPWAHSPHAAKNPKVRSLETINSSTKQPRQSNSCVGTLLERSESCEWMRLLRGRILIDSTATRHKRLCVVTHEAINIRRALRMPRHDGLDHDQLVFDQFQQVEMPRECQNVVVRISVEPFCFRLITRKTDGTRDEQMLSHRLQATLALHVQLSLSMQIEPELRLANALGHESALGLPADGRQRCQAGLIKGRRGQARQTAQRQDTLELCLAFDEGFDVELFWMENAWFHRSILVLACSCPLSANLPRGSLVDNRHMHAPAPTALPRLVLGSSSIYRQELLSRLGHPFDTRSPNVDESPLSGESPIDLACRLALSKAQAVSVEFENDVIIIGSDQVADLGGQALGKPGTHAGAVKQLRALSGHVVRFHTAICVMRPRRQQVLQTVDTVTVTFRQLSHETIEAYLHREQPYDCAGSAKCEGLGISLLDRIQSEDPTSLIGLPLIATTRLLREVGWDPLACTSPHKECRHD
jgi:septum formation protein